MAIYLCIHLCGHHPDREVGCDGKEIRKLFPAHSGSGEKQVQAEEPVVAAERASR